MVDQLAIDYASQPVVFLEYHTSSSVAPSNNRRSRFSAAHTYQEGDKLPYIIVDSGHQYQVHYSVKTAIYGEYKSKVDAELKRPPQAEIQAVETRVGNKLQYKVTVKNTSGVRLSSANKATVHVLVWEDKKVGVTSRYVRAAPWVEITTALEPGATGTFNLTTPELSGVDWTKLHALALVDYRPAGKTGPYDMLQASMVVSNYFTVQPQQMAFLVDAGHPVDKTATLTMTGAPSTLTWAISEDIPWLEVTPTSGPLGANGTAAAQVKVLANQLPPGVKQSGTLTITTPGAGYSVTVPVNAFLGSVEKNFAPVMRK